jgi:hypothetical protein
MHGSSHCVKYPSSLTCSLLHVCFLDLSLLCSALKISAARPAISHESRRLAARQTALKIVRVSAAYTAHPELRASPRSKYCLLPGSRLEMGVVQ